MGGKAPQGASNLCLPRGLQVTGPTAWWRVTVQSGSLRRCSVMTADRAIPRFSAAPDEQVNCGACRTDRDGGRDEEPAPTDRDVVSASGARANDQPAPGTDGQAERQLSLHDPEDLLSPTPSTAGTVSRHDLNVRSGQPRSVQNTKPSCQS